MIHVIIPVLDELTYEKYQKTERNYCPSQKFFSMLRKGLCSVRDDLIFYSYIDKIKSKYISKDTQINYVEFSKKTERASAVKKMMELVILKAKRDDVIIADCNDYLCVCAALKVRKKIGCKVIGVITDFPQHVYSYSADRIHDNKFIRILKVINAYRKLLYIKEPDAFVLLTEAMTDIVGKKKPYVVVEGFCDTEKVNLKVLKKKKRILYT